jgi:hypothetical protein
MAMIAVMLTGCAPTPTPTPTPTAPFASEEEAFAAAEETYRAYTDALNAVDPADPATFEAVFEFTTGDFEATDRENLSTMHAEELSVIGSNKVVGFHGLSASSSLDSVEARVCVDVSDVQILDSSGASHVSPDRPAIYVVDVSFAAENKALVIRSAVHSEASECD